LSYIAVIGEAVADTFVSPEQSGQGTLDLRVRPGGGPANTAVGSSAGSPETCWETCSATI
jgi:sugar/nucleoside kinase (ribokinase family)